MERGKMRGMQRLLLTLVAPLVVFACGTEPVELGENKEGSFADYETTRFALGLSENVVAYQEYVVDEFGNILSEQSFMDELPDGVWEMVHSGQPDDEGYKYVYSIGERAPGNGTTTRFQQLEKMKFAQVPPTQQLQAAKPTTLPPTTEAMEPALTPLEKALEMSSPDDMLYVYALLVGKPTTKLGKHHYGGFASPIDAASALEAHQKRLEARKKEMASLQADAIAYAKALGAEGVSPSFLSNSFQTHVPAQAIPLLYEHPDIDRIGLVQEAEPAGYWDGGDMKVSGGTNTGVLVDVGYNGQMINPAYNDILRIMIIDVAMDIDHPGFDDWQYGPSRVHSYWTCTGTGCTQTMADPTRSHGTTCAGLAAGDFRDGQYAHIEDGDDSWRRRRTGQAEEAELVLVTTSGGGITKALELAVTLPVDVISRSMVFGGDTNCDGMVEGSTFNEDAYEVYEAGILLVNGAGNAEPEGDECTLKGSPDVLSVFTVGGVASSASECDYTNYLSCDLYDGPGGYGTAQGGVDLIVDSTLRWGVYTAIDVLTDACPRYQYKKDGTYGTYNTSCGTSYATPQVAGAAILHKHWMLYNWGTGINNPGWLFVMTLGMSDRAYPYGHRIYGFDKRWGGGRYQLRRFSPSGADVTPPYWWSVGTVNLSDWEAWTQQIGGDDDPEPSQLTHYKAYAWYAEETPWNVADIDMHIQKNCDGTPTIIRSDNGYDTKLMARIDDSGADESLCMKLYGFGVPTGETRDVHFFHYYSSGSTAGK